MCTIYIYREKEARLYLKEMNTRILRINFTSVVSFSTFFFRCYCCFLPDFDFFFPEISVCICKKQTTEIVSVFYFLAKKVV